MKKIKIGCFNWELVEDYDATQAMDGSYGCCLDKSLKILIDPSLKGQNRHETIVHEVLHACIYVSGLRQIIDDKISITEELMVRMLSPLVYQVFRDNDLFEKSK